MEFIRPFNKLNKHDAPIAGGKGASLGEMTQAGIPVPPGFVVLSSAFDYFIDKTEIKADIDAVLHKVNHKEVHTVEEASEEIKGIIMAEDMPKEIAKEILEHHKKLGASFVAVRSSATAEDSASAAWAGQLESYLNTTKEELLANVKRCWASLFTPRAIFYRFEKQLHKQEISVAVVVQKMVNSEKSGIAFSVHPVTQDYNQLIIEAGFGLGEAIVSGQITPDSYVVEKKGWEIVEKAVNEQNRAMYRGKNGGNVWHDLGTRGAEQVLSEKEILELARLIVKIEGHYQFPVDVEFAQEKGKFYIVQSRPITTLGALASEREEEDEWVFMWSSVPTMTNYWATPVIFRRGIDHFPKASIFQYYDGKVISAYMLKSDLERYKEEESPKFLDPRFFRNYRQKYLEERKKWWKWIRKIEKKDYNNVSRKELAKDHNQFVIFMTDAISYFGSTRPEFTFQAEQELETILSTTYGNNWPEIFGATTTPRELDDIQKEQVDWLQLLSKKVTSKMLLSHASKYPWLLFGPMSDDEVIDHFHLRIKNETTKYIDKLKEITKRKRSLMKEQHHIYDSFEKDKKKVRYLASFLQIQAIERMNIKAYWAGSYYLSTKMWLKIAQELELSIADLIMFATPPEIQDILNKKFSENIFEIIKDRKKGFAIEYLKEQSAIKMLDSLKAKKIFKKRVNKIKDEMTIKGQTASLGVYTGNARKVIAGDLEMLKENINNFKKGDVLITSMTQPNMMVLAQKAGAIIADEGGITSHAAIISRELRIPCIVGCLHAMQTLRDGDLIEVDADKGIVRILKKEKEDYLSEKKLVFEKSITRDWGIIYAEVWHEVFTSEFKKQTGWGYTEVVFEGKDNTITVYRAPTEHLEGMRSHILKNLDKNPKWLDQKAEKVKQQVDETIRFSQKIKSKPWSTYTNPSLGKILQTFTHKNIELGPSFIMMLWFPIQMESYPRLDQYKTAVETAIETRKAIEKIGPLTDSFCREIAEEFCRRRNIVKELARFVSYKEILERLGKGKPLDKKKLLERQKYFIVTNKGILSTPLDVYLTSQGYDLDLQKTDSVTEFKGTAAYKGLIRGKVRIIHNKEMFNRFQDKEILVTGMTTPDFLVVAEKSAAFITDEGGVTCHAAILARELKKPCIIGTKIATKVLKDGDLVEVDANTGIVKIIKRK